MSIEIANKLLSPEIRVEIDRWVAKYPPDRKQSAVISALHSLQNYHNGWLTRDSLDAVADYLDMPKIAVYEVASFYSMFDLQEVGQYKINVCTNISCLLRGSEEVVKHFEKRLGIKVGETTADGKFTLREVECLAACVCAPVCEINCDYHETLTPEKIDKILEELT
jgi:NADH-quinone oxidoreductase subunit E